MPENRGCYQKYHVERTDGKQIAGRTFTMEIDRDPYAREALIGYRHAAARDGKVPAFVASLDEIIAGLPEA